MPSLGEMIPKLLVERGVDTVFGVPGVHTVEMYRGMPGSGLTHHTPRHEQGAGFMAATYGRLTGKTGVCLATLGPGATNLVTAAAYAQLGAMPMLMITGQKPIKSSKQGHFQIIDAVDMMRPITKWADTCFQTARIGEYVEKFDRIVKKYKLTYYVNERIH